MHILNGWVARRVRCTLFNRVEEKFFDYHVGEAYSAASRGNFPWIFTRWIRVNFVGGKSSARARWDGKATDGATERDLFHVYAWSKGFPPFDNIIYDRLDRFYLRPVLSLISFNEMTIYAAGQERRGTEGGSVVGHRNVRTVAWHIDIGI